MSAVAKNAFIGAIPFRAGVGYLPGLDGLRAISILLVMVSHLGFEHIIPGGLGVTVFFFVSGFLITRLLVSEQNNCHGKIDLPNFYVRRFLRLMPALFVFVAIVSIAATPFGGKPLAIHIFAALFYFVNYYSALETEFGWPIRAVPWGHLWSLCVEEHFYLLFPAALALLGKTHRSRLFLTVSVIILCATWRFVAYQFLGFSEEYTQKATDTRLENIVWGCLLAILLDGAPELKARLRWLVGWHWVGLGLGAILFSLLYRDEMFRATLRYSVQGASLFILMLNIYALRSAQFALDLLELKPFRFTGRLSYSLYLWHMPVIFFAKKLEGIPDAMRMSPFMMVGTIIVSFALAWLSYYFVEKPIFGLRERFGGKPVENLVRG